MKTTKTELHEDDADWAALAMRLAPVAPPPAVADRLRARIMAGTAAASRLRTVRKSEDGWTPFCPLVDMKVLREDGASTTALFRLQAGAQLPLHSHGEDEECFIVEGEIFLGGQLLRAGDYQLAAEGSHHVNCHTTSGCVMLVRAPSASFAGMTADSGSTGA